MENITTSNYTIYLEDALSEFDKYLSRKDYSSIHVLLDENTKRDCWPLLFPIMKDHHPYLIEIESGENSKTINSCQVIWKNLVDQGADRHSLMVNLGGGVIGDMGGFCASTFMRGIDFIQIPTTLLSQVDASIGGKLGVDFLHLKNMVGLFQNPRNIYIHSPFLSTLPKRELISGFAEMIKHGLIWDRKLWNELTEISDLNWSNLSSFISKAILVKREIVELDPFEKGIRKFLNFGHTLGHALESAKLSGESQLLHGEAIAAGMIMESYISNKKIGLPDSDLGQITQYLATLFPFSKISAQEELQLLKLLRSDKKNKGSKVLMVGIEGISTPKSNIEIDDQDVSSAIAYYNLLDNK